MKRVEKPTNITSPAVRVINDRAEDCFYVKHSWFQDWRSHAEKEARVKWWKIISKLLFKINSLRNWRYLNFLLWRGEHFRAEINEKIVRNELDLYRGFFDKVEKTPLTKEQRLAAVVFEDRNLLVAAAGSGKTSSIIGKIGYALQRDLYKPNEILVLAFNRKASKELNGRIKDRLGSLLGGALVRAHTFHACGRAIVSMAAKREGLPLRVAGEAESKKRISLAVSALMKQPEFLRDYWEFSALYGEPLLPEKNFESKADYQKYISDKRTLQKQGGGVEFQALSGDIVRSAEELRIANWLFLNGVPFEYEKQFPNTPSGWSKYEPDFYYPDIKVWHEHFALNSEGIAPSFLDKYYAENAARKRKYLSNTVKNLWFETRSHQVFDGSVFDWLKSELKGRGQVFNPLTATQIEAAVKNLDKTEAKGLAIEILPLAKERFVAKEGFSELASLTHDSDRAHRFGKIFYQVLHEYNNGLHRDRTIDFNDMIVRASDILEYGRIKFPYKLILVDEFQDISHGRARFLKALLSSQQDSVLFAVGDDWQAINGFSGSDVRLFMEFDREFGFTREENLSVTFRHPQGIADVGAKFIMENAAGQKAKKVKSDLSPETHGLVDLVDIEKNELLINEINIRLEKIEKLSGSSDIEDSRKTSILILSRYGIDKTGGINASWLAKIKSRYQNSLNIECMTIHSSKGLEADHVFVAGVNSGWGLTFPSNMTTDPLVDLVLGRTDDFPYAEERRLFYVALTRAKKSTSVFFLRLSPSPFVMELIHQKYRGLVTFRGGRLPAICEQCQKGYMVVRNGRYGKFYGCTRYSTDKCTNTQPCP